MKTKIPYLLALFVMCTLSAFGVDFLSQPSMAGRASMTDKGFYLQRLLEAARFSPDLRMPVQLMYHSTSNELGMFGFAWSCPQLESAAIPEKDGVVWRTPWGEKISFAAKKSMDKEATAIYKDSMQGAGKYFAPYTDWEATTNTSESRRESTGNWVFIGKGDNAGWQFIYEDAKLVKVSAPSGYELEYVYDGERLKAVSQDGREFIKLTWNDTGCVAAMSVNDVAYTFDYANKTVQVLPQTPDGAATNDERTYLAAVRQGDLNPVHYEYNESGYVVGITQGEMKEALKVREETIEERRRQISEAADAKNGKGAKDKKPTVVLAHVGRLLEDDEMTYSYPGNRVGHVQFRNKLNQEADHNYNAETGVYKVTDFSGKSRTMYYYKRYDVAYMGKVRQITDERGRTVADYRYDAKTGKPVRSTDMAGNDTVYQYDASGNLTSVSTRGADEKDAVPVTAYEYDAKGNPVKIMQVDEHGKPEAAIQVSYNNRSLPVEVDTGLRKSQVVYSKYGYPLEYKDAFGQKTKLRYDDTNRVTAVETPNGMITVYAYNANGQVAKVETRADSRVVNSQSLTYDKNGQPVATTDRKGRTQHIERDTKGRLAKIVDADGSHVELAYDAVGHLKQVTDQNNNTITFDYNRFGLIKNTTAADQVMERVYDNFGRLTGVTSAYRGKEKDSIRTFVYDELDRLTQATYGEGQTEDLAYDTWGRVTEAKRSDGKKASYKYDRRGRVVEKTEGDVTTSYAYNAYGQRTKRTVKSASGVAAETREYDNFGRLSRLEAEGSEVLYTYNTLNQLARQIVNGTVIDFKYDKYGRLIGKSMADASGKTPAAELKYFYDVDGSLLAREFNGKRLTYVHDAKGQLVSVMDGGKEVEKYVYDPAGNIMSKEQNGEVISYTYDRANQLKTMQRGADTIAFAYDGAGRLVKEGDKSYRYGWLDKVMAVEDAKTNSQLGMYAYGMDGQLASATWGNKTDTFLWDGLALVNKNGETILNEPAVSGGNPVAVNGNIFFNDILGSTLGVMNKKNEFVSTLKTSFGETAKSSTSDDFFTGKPYVEGLGYAFLYRNYRPDLGKWQTADPKGYPDGWNNLAYCNNNVMTCIDVLGTDVYHALAPNAAQGYGHSAWIVGNDTSGYAAYSYGPEGTEVTTMGHSSVQAAMDSLNSYRGSGSQYTKLQSWSTTQDEDSAAKMAVPDYLNSDDYGKFLHNCYQMGPDAIIAAINKMREKEGKDPIRISNDPRPNNAFDENNKNGATNIPLE